MLILVSEIKTKTESRFKEAFIALLSLCEMGSWITFIVFKDVRQGKSGVTALALIALGMYVMINLLHACIHSRNMLPKTQPSYKKLNYNYKFWAYTIRAISYLFSYKFSLLLVSYLWVKPRFSGDYSDSNWF